MTGWRTTHSKVTRSRSRATPKVKWEEGEDAPASKDRIYQIGTGKPTRFSGGMRVPIGDDVITAKQYIPTRHIVFRGENKMKTLAEIRANKIELTAKPGEHIIVAADKVGNRIAYYGPISRDSRVPSFFSSGDGVFNCETTMHTWVPNNWKPDGEGIFHKGAN